MLKGLYTMVRHAALAWSSHAVVKSRERTGIRRNLNRPLWFNDADGFIAIGFVRASSPVADVLSLSMEDPGVTWEKVRQIGTIPEASNATSMSAARKQVPISQGLITQAPLGTA
jgi:hypothetical protein